MGVNDIFEDVWRVDSQFAVENGGFGLAQPLQKLIPIDIVNINFFVGVFADGFILGLCLLNNRVIEGGDPWEEGSGEDLLDFRGQQLQPGGVLLIVDQYFIVDSFCFHCNKLSTTGNPSIGGQFLLYLLVHDSEEDDALHFLDRRPNPFLK